MASRFDTSGDNWQDVVATLYEKTTGDLPKEIGLLSALLADQRLAPAKSATRHWAVLQLAKLYENAGDNISARALRKATLSLKLPPDVAEFFGKTHTAAELEKAGTDFGADPRYADPARRVDFLTKAFKQRVAGEGFPNSDSFLNLGLLVDALARIGDLSQRSPLTDTYIDQFLATLSKQALLPPFVGIGVDNYRNELRVNLDLLTEELAKNGFSSAAEKVRRAGFNFETDRIRADTVADLLVGSDITGSFVAAKDLSERLVAAGLILPSVDAFDRAFIGPLLDANDFVSSLA